ncbi:nuclear transport factor 2 family protein [Arthrobacter globiformis]|uniref:nuclear transport factor 2 family protein n=1 Tax=Arthrobacter globiformis TaxID=1665 RepID=UPI0027817C1A|nr:nuclear transport factor 2 family protein [Arthrobacter globiformis]MDQ0867317.1 hypothetical protein [Arthrobacter globiformis]
MTAASTPEACTPAWAHATGVIDLQPVAPVPSDLTALADRLMVMETASRYAIAYDERRVSVIESLFTESVTFSYRVGEGPLSSEHGRAHVISWLEEVMQSQSDQRRHLLGSMTVEHLTASEAVVIAYMANFGIEKEAQLVTTGFYRFRMVKEDNRWKIDEAIDALDRPF